MDSKQTQPSEPIACEVGDLAAIEPRSPGSDSHLSVIHDSLQLCPYREGQVARMPLEYPRQRITPRDLDRLLACGYRRTGPMFYRTFCPSCRECIPTRVKAASFQFTRSMKRILNRGRRELTVQWGQPGLDRRRLELFNQHRAQRQLSRSGPADLSDYHEFLVATSVETLEIAFFQEGQLVGVSIVDQGEQSLNAVYTHFSPEAGRFSIGTLAVLLQIEQARKSDREFVYLGLFVAENPHLNYKARFRPQQRLIGGKWQSIDAD